MHIEPVDPADAVRARVTGVWLSHRENAAAALGDGLVDRALKDLCALRLAGDVAVTATSDRERAALAWADAIAHDPAAAGDALWDELRRHFTEAQLVELGYAIAYLHGQQRWTATLGL